MAQQIERQKLRLIVQGFLNGDSAQYRIIKSKITQYIYYQNFGADVDKDDLVSETIEILFNNLRKGRFRGDSLAALNVYIFNILKFRINRIIRRRERLTYSDDTLEYIMSESPTPAAEIANKELAGKIFNSLDAKCRELLRLKFHEGWSDQEIADHIERSKNATSTAISRCLQKAKNLDFVREIV